MQSNMSRYAAIESLESVARTKNRYVICLFVQRFAMDWDVDSVDFSINNKLRSKGLFEMLRYSQFSADCLFLVYIMNINASNK